MADEENQPPEHEPQPEAAGNEPTVAQPEQAGDEPQAEPPANDAKAESAEPEPKTPEPARPSKPESRFSILTALISAIAALVGALVGGIASYMVAQSNNTAEAEAALAKSRLTDYADYLTAQIDVSNSAYLLLAYLQDTSRDTRTLSDAYVDFIAKQEKSVHSDYIVSLIDSDTVDPLRDAMGKQDDAIKETADKLYGQVISNPNIALDPSALKDFKAEIDSSQKLQDNFTDVSRADMTPPKRRLFPWSFSWAWVGRTWTWVGRTLEWALPLTS
jgi:hypothetical protein